MTLKYPCFRRVEFGTIGFVSINAFEGSQRMELERITVCDYSVCDGLSVRLSNSAVRHVSTFGDSLVSC